MQKEINQLKKEIENILNDNKALEIASYVISPEFPAP